MTREEFEKAEKAKKLWRELKGIGEEVTDADLLFLMEYSDFLRPMAWREFMKRHQVPPPYALHYIIDYVEPLRPKAECYLKKTKNEDLLPEREKSLKKKDRARRKEKIMNDIINL